MAFFYLNTYAPLAATKVGRTAAIKYSLPPFIDGSIRREPDLLHEYPAISCLSLAHKFVPWLEVDDVVAYLLKAKRYGMGYKHRRLTAVLRVIDVFETHAEGAAWYRDKRLRLPNNCMVPRNKAFPLSRSHQRAPQSAGSSVTANNTSWDKDNQKQTDKRGAFVICERLFVNLDWDAPEVSEEILKTAFGKVPCSLNPKKQTVKAGQRLLTRIGLSHTLQLQ